MKPLICLYAEGNDTKIAVLSKEKDTDKLKVFRTGTVSTTPSSVDIEAGATGVSMDEGGFQLEGIEGESATPPGIRRAPRGVSST